MIKLLKCYPFPRLKPAVALIEGFAAYDGHLGDEVGKVHKGIDYVRRAGKERFLPFTVHATHDGEAWQGVSNSWGKFAAIRFRYSSVLQFWTVHAHLEKLFLALPAIPPGKPLSDLGSGMHLRAGDKLGVAGITGDTKNIIQLHFELIQITHSLRGAVEQKSSTLTGYITASALASTPSPAKPSTGCSITGWTVNPGLRSSTKAVNMAIHSGRFFC